MAAQSVALDHSDVIRLGDHARKLIDEFLAAPATGTRSLEFIAKFDQISSEFGRLRAVEMRAARKCSICEQPIDHSELEPKFHDELKPSRPP